MPAFSPPLIPLTTSVGRVGTELENTQLNAIGRASLDRPASTAFSVEYFLDHQRAEERDRVPDTALLGGRRNDRDVAQLDELLLQGRQSRGVDPIIVGQQYLHAILSIALGLI